MCVPGFQVLQLKMMKVHVKERADGMELTFPSFAEFQTLWMRKFISDDDLVRREGSTRWIRAGDLPELRTMKDMARGNVQWGVWLTVGVTAFTLIVALIFQRSL